MVRRAALTLIVLLLLLWAPAAAEAARSRPCGDLVREGAGVYRVQATNASCPTARRVARAWERRCVSARSARCRVAGYSCRYRDAGYEVVRVRCARGPSVVRFEWGS